MDHHNYHDRPHCIVVYKLFHSWVVLHICRLPLLFYTLHHDEDQPEQEGELGQHKQAEPQRCRGQACVACSRAYLTSELSLKYVHFDNRNAVGA